MSCIGLRRFLAAPNAWYQLACCCWKHYFNFSNPQISPRGSVFFSCGRSDRAWQSIVLWGIQMCLGILPARPLPGCICDLKTTLTNQSCSVFPLALTPPWHFSVSPCFRTLPIFSGFLEWYLSFVMVQVPPPPGGLLQSPRH